MRLPLGQNQIAIAVTRALEAPHQRIPLATPTTALTNTGFVDRPYFSFSSELPMIDVDLPTPKDVHQTDPDFSSLGEVWDLLSRHSRDRGSSFDLSLTPGGIHATSLDERFVPKDRQKMRGFESAFPLRLQALLDEGFQAFSSQRPEWGRRAGPKRFRSGDFVSAPLTEFNPEKALSSSRNDLRDYRSVVDFLRPPNALEGLREVAGWHERQGDLSPQQKALLRALYGLGIGGVGAASTLQPSED